MRVCADAHLEVVHGAAATLGDAADCVNGWGCTRHSFDTKTLPTPVLAVVPGRCRPRREPDLVLARPACLRGHLDAPACSRHGLVGDDELGPGPVAAVAVGGHVERDLAGTTGEVERLLRIRVEVGDAAAVVHEATIWPSQTRTSDGIGMLRRWRTRCATRETR